MNGASGNRISIVAAERVIVTVGQVQTAEMTITINADVTNFDPMRPHVPDQRGPHQKSIAIEFATGAIVVVKRARLYRVAFPDEILSKNIRNVHVLMSPIKTIEAAVCVFLELREISGIVLVAIVSERTKDSRTQIVVGKDKAAKI